MMRKKGMRPREMRDEGSLVEKLLYKMSEAAERLDLGLTKTYQLVNSGQLRVVHIGRAIRVPADALTEFVEGLVRSEGDG